MTKLLKILLWIAIAVAVVSVAGRLFLFEIAQTSSYSMVPTLVKGDVFAVLTRGLIGKADIAVCAHPENPEELVALRVIGLPGEEISFWRNHVKIGGDVVQHSVEGALLYVDDTAEEPFEYAVRLAEEYVGGSRYRVALMDRAGDKEAQPVVVPEGHFFVVGDNRNLASDSRHFGTVPIDSCIGKAVFLLWPGKDSGDLKRRARIFTVL